MADILGLTVSDFPFLRMKPANMPWVLWGNLAWGWRNKPHLRDPANWPAPMRAEWGSEQDQGRTAGAAHQLRQHDHRQHTRRRGRGDLQSMAGRRASSSPRWRWPLASGR